MEEGRDREDEYESELFFYSVCFSKLLPWFTVIEAVPHVLVLVCVARNTKALWRKEIKKMYSKRYRKKGN